MEKLKQVQFENILETSS